VDIVREKPRIARQPDGRWAVTRPVFGFATWPDQTFHDSWQAAVSSLTEGADRFAGGGSFERAKEETDLMAPVPVWTPLEY
jgi:hypothetical protein